MSLVWNYATKRKNPVTQEIDAICLRCNNTIKCSGGSTTTLKSHLKSKHGIDCTAAPSKEIEKQVIEEKKAKTIPDFFNRKSLKEIISDMATDGISIRAITRNKYIQDSIKRDGFKLPQNETRIMKLIHADFEEKKSKMVEEIKSKTEKGIKLSMTVDEYTTVRRRRYFGINLHDGEDKKTYKIGLVRIFGSCNAETMALKVKAHLEEFGINYVQDIVGSTQDGAAINYKFMKIMKVIDQYCLNHAIHLGVCDSLYKNNSVLQSVVEVDSNDSDESDNFDDAFVVEVIQEENFDHIDFNETLQNARNVVKFIRNSTVRNQIFQSRVITEFGNEIELHLDVKHRWNSIPIMIAPLIKTKRCLFEAFSELNSLNIINRLDFDALLMLQNVMEPIKLAVETLSREDSTLLTAETVVEFMLNKLSNLNSSISLELYENIKKRTNERWNTDVMNLLRCLKDPSNIPSKNTISFAGNLASRLFGVDEVDVSGNEQNFEVQTSQPTTANISLKDELNLLLQKENLIQSTAATGNFKWLKQEFILFKNTGKRTANLQKLFDALLSIKPTSTDVERVFSVCTNFCTKIRSRLSDTSLNALVFLKFYYKKKLACTN